MIGEPPLSLGAVQLRLICDDDTGVAVSPVGGCGMVGIGLLVVVADAVFDGGLVPSGLIADTRYVYVVFAPRPVSLYVVAVLRVFGTIVDQVLPPSVDLSIL